MLHRSPKSTLSLERLTGFRNLAADVDGAAAVPAGGGDGRRLADRRGADRVISSGMFFVSFRSDIRRM
ncbi:hypothetical protein WMF45_49365 [Sorangium sp. So ce448]|uniref:hypothetical protein n=1 Tax=Sorangium sp. So ce448 TaxID=3133314 RepID=UPI003F5DBED1